MSHPFNQDRAPLTLLEQLTYERTGITSPNWKTEPATNLEQEIANFKRDLPGWWYSICECERTCDASCAPTRESFDIALVEVDERFNEGFHADLPQPSSLAMALRAVRLDALAAKGDNYDEYEGMGG